MTRLWETAAEESTAQASAAQVITAQASTEFVRSPGLPQVELRRSAQDRSCYRPHTHERYSVGIIDSGTTHFTGAVVDPVRLVPGDVILIPAGFVHACNPDSGRWEYRMIHAEEAWLAALHPGAAEHLVTGIRIVRHEPAFHRFAEVSALLSDEADPHRVASAFRAGLDEAARARGRRTSSPRTITPRSSPCSSRCSRSWGRRRRTRPSTNSPHSPAWTGTSSSAR